MSVVTDDTNGYFHRFWSEHDQDYILIRTGCEIPRDHVEIECRVSGDYTCKAWTVEEARKIGDSILRACDNEDRRSL